MKANSITQIRFTVRSLTVDSRNGQNFGFPLLPYFSRKAPFLSAVMAFYPQRTTIKFPKLILYQVQRKKANAMLKTIPGQDLSQLD